MSRMGRLHFEQSGASAIVWNLFVAGGRYERECCLDQKRHLQDCPAL
jgi:hypothetical protein